MYEDTADAVRRQPIGYWTGEAYRRVSTKIRQTLADNDLSQPQWWILNHLASAAWEKRLLLSRLAPYSDNEEGRGLEAELGDLLGRGLVSDLDEGGLRLTAVGAASLAVSRRLNAEANDRMLAGVSDEDVITCVNVLRRLVNNLGGNDSLR